MPKVTVATICYNDLDNLRKTIESNLRQSYQDVEFLIVDGDSKDKTKDYLQTLSDKRVHWISGKDKGIYDAMNKAARMAEGEWIIFMNSADTFVDEYVLDKVFSNSQTENADIIYGDVMKNGTVKVAEKVHNSHRMFFCHQCAFVRTQILRETPFDITYRMSADFKFFKTMVLKHKRFLKVDFPIADFDTNGVSNTRRSEGIRENLAIVLEMDNLLYKIKLAPKLVFQYIMCKLRGK